MSAETRIIIADDHPLFRQGLRQGIEAAPGLKVIGEAGDGQAALDLLQRWQPEIAMLDIGMPVLDGFAVVREVNRLKLPVGLIFLTAHREEALFDEALALGVKGYLLKESAMVDVQSAIRTVLAGQHYASPSLTSYLFRRRQSQVAPPNPAVDLSVLTPTERQVLQLIADYKTSKEIAEVLCVSHHTIETHRRNICERLGLHGSHALMKFALTHKAELT